MSTKTSLVGATLLGKLQVIRIVGEGGMGIVYEVEHLITKHRRALKVLHPEFAKNRDVVERFVREAGVAGTLRSPFVVETYDAGQLEDGSPYVVMELLDGVPLSSLLERFSKLSVPVAASVIAQVCDGVAVAHRAGIVHRDLKPENIFIVRAGEGNESVKILDFGISKFAGGDKQLTTAGTTMGTPAYMPSEQLQGLPDVDGRADIYALGVILYEALSGKRPFEADNYVTLALRVYQGEHDHLSTVEPTLDREIVAIVERAIATEKEHRFRSAEELADALRRVAVREDFHLLQLAHANTDRPTVGDTTGPIYTGSGAYDVSAPTQQNVALAALPATRLQQTPPGLMAQNTPAVMPARAALPVSDPKVAALRGAAIVFVFVLLAWSIWKFAFSTHEVAREAPRSSPVAAPAAEAPMPAAAPLPHEAAPMPQIQPVVAPVVATPVVHATHPAKAKPQAAPAPNSEGSAPTKRGVAIDSTNPY